MSNDIKNDLKYGKGCIGQIVYDSKGNKATIKNMYTIDKKKCMVTLEYEDGYIVDLYKSDVKKGRFAKRKTIDNTNRINKLEYGKECIGQKVVDSNNNEGIITDLQTINGSKVQVKIEYEDGTSQIRDKISVSKGLFRKPEKFILEEYLKSDKWKQVVDFEEYYIINKEGKIIRIKGKNKGRIRTPIKRKDGYFMCMLFKDFRKERKNTFIHKIVAETFIRKTIDGEQVNHIDGNRGNYKLYNLEIIPIKENNNKYINFSRMGINEKQFKSIEIYCMNKNINLNEFLGYCIKKVLNI